LPFNYKLLLLYVFIKSIRMKLSKNQKVPFIGVVVIAVVAIGVAVYGISKSKKDSVRAALASWQTGDIQTFQSSRILHPLTTFSDDIRYSLKNIRPFDDWGNSFFLSPNARTTTRGHGEPAYKGLTRNALASGMVKVTPPLAPKAALRMIAASDNCRGSSTYSGTGLAGALPHH
jgi:hypothetical protein